MYPYGSKGDGSEYLHQSPAPATRPAAVAKGEPPKTPDSPMKKSMTLLFLLLLLSAALSAQVPVRTGKMMEEAQAKMKAIESNPEIQGKMKMARHLLDSLNASAKFQKKMASENSLWDSLKKDHPEIGNAQIPDLAHTPIPQMPNLDSISASMNASLQRLDAFSQSIDQTTPKLNPLHQIESLPRLSEETLIALATVTLKSVKTKLDPVALSKLNAMVKDTSINKANIGAFFLATRASSDAALFLICQSIIDDPQNIWAINDLGVYYRNTMDYERSLEYFLYANTLDTGKNTAINTNIGWASAYYGDFTAANKYFDQALRINTDFQSANEGKAMVAYAQGDIKALFQCLAKEIKYIGGGGGGSGPSGTFASTCGGVYSENNAEKGDNSTSDPGNDHTFDNSRPDDAPDAPPGADVDDIMYPNFRKAFVSKPEDIAQGFATGTKQGAAAIRNMKSRVTQLIQMQKGLKPLGQKPYKDAEGYLIYPTNFEKYVDLLAPIDELLDKRLSWYRGKLAVKLKALNKDVTNHDGDMIHQYLQALAGCDDDDACERRVKCAWLPRLYGSKNNDLDVIAKMWDDYYSQVSGAIQWYIDATGPLISHVHQQGWNQFLNARRQYSVRVAIIGAYSMWTMALGEILTDMCAVVKLPTPECPPIEMRSVSAPNPFSKKPKHIKEFEGPCYNMKFDCGIGGIEENCHTTKFFIGIGPAKLFLEHADDPIYAQNHEYANKVGGTLSADMMIGLNSDNEYKAIGLDPEDQLAGAKAGIDAKVEGTLWLQFNANNQITSVGVDGSISAEAGVSGEVKGGAKIEANTSLGVEASKSWQLVAGQNGLVGNPGTVKVKTD